MVTRSREKAHKAVLCRKLGRDGLKLRPLMDLWIMGLLYKLIVRGSRLHGAFGEKGLVRSLHPTSGMCGRGPVFFPDVKRTVCLDGGTNRRSYERDRTIRQPQNQRDSDDLLGSVQKADENGSSGDFDWISCVGITVQWIFFSFVHIIFSLLFVFLKFFSFLPPSNLPFATGFTSQYWVHPENHSAE